MRPQFEVADVFHRHGPAYIRAHGAHMGRVERRVMSAVQLCRTAALGGHVEACDSCSFVRNAYNSCRNRHCPKCQSLAQGAWLERRQADLLPVPYFHVVFTMPAPIADIAFHNKSVVYAILFKAAAATLRTIAADPKHLGADIGLVAVLHTWGQNLHHHPHVHCVVPGGGPSLDGAAWVGCRRKFLLPVKVLARLYRRLFLHELEAARSAGQIKLAGALAPLSESGAFEDAMRQWRRINWVVYAKAPFGGATQVLAYLGRYTHRVAIANSRIVALGDDSVSFSWRDYRDNSRQKVMKLDAHDFIRRFLQHTLPDGFHRIRHYGFLANSLRVEKLALARRLLGVRAPEGPPPTNTAAERLERLTGRALDACPCCGGHLTLSHVVLAFADQRPPRGWDSS
jgi:hypothetical protein